MQRIINLYRDSFSGLSREIKLLTLVTLINRSGTMVFPFIAIFLTQEEGFSYSEAGIILAFFGAGSVFGTYIGGILTDKFGYYKVMFWSLLLGGCSMLNLLFINSLEMWCAGVFLITAIGDCFRPASMAAVGFYSKPENRTRSLGLIRLAVNLGFGVGPAFGGLIAQAFGFDWIFIIDGATCISSAFFFILLLKESKEDLSALESNKEAQDKPSLSPYRDKTFLIFVFSLLISSIVFLQFNSTLGIYVTEVLGYTEGQWGWLLAMNGFIIAFIEMPLIYILEKRANLLPIIAIGVFMFGSSFELFAWSSWAGVAIISMLLLTFGEIISFPFSASFSLSRAIEENRGRYMGLYGLSFSIGHIIAPMSGLHIVEHYGYDTLWHVLLGLTSLSVMGIMYVNYLVHHEKKLKPAIT